MKNSLLLFVLLCTLNLPAMATNVSGPIQNNTTWTLANSPYVVTGDLVVFDNVVLTIDAGVQVLVDSTVKIEIKGKLRVNGTASSEVVIKGNTSTDNWRFWQGISFTGAKSSPADTLQADVMYCRISNASVAIDHVNGARPPYKFRYCTFTHNHTAGGEAISGGSVFDHCTFKYSSTALYNPGAEITNCVFDSNAIGLHWTEMVRNCKFTNHSQYAIRQVNQIVNCEITNNNIGIEAVLSPMVDGVVDNKIMNNDTGIVIYSCYGNQHKFRNNKICSNNYSVVATTTFGCDLPYNCWCTMDSTTVRGTIYDGYTNMTLGVVSFMPMDSVCTPTSVPGMPADNAATVTVYPNPNNGTFTLQLANTHFKSASIQVYDIMGRECYKSQVTNSQSRITLNQPKGIYMIKLQLDETILTKRVIVE